MIGVGAVPGVHVARRGGMPSLVVCGMVHGSVHRMSTVIGVMIVGAVLSAVMLLVGHEHLPFFRRITEARDLNSIVA